MKPYPSLRAYLTGYLHEDWMLDGARPSDLVPRYISDAGDEAGYQFIGEIEVILAESLSNRELRELVEQSGSRYDPGAEGGEVRLWLQDLRDSAVADFLGRD